MAAIGAAILLQMAWAIIHPFIWIVPVVFVIVAGVIVYKRLKEYYGGGGDDDLIRGR